MAEILIPGAQAGGNQLAGGRDVGRKDAAMQCLVDVGAGEERIRWSRPAEQIEVEAELDGV